MNKTAIKNYAVDARKKWIAAIAQQAAFYGCTESEILSDDEITKKLADRRIFLSQNEKSARSSLVNDIRSKGYRNTIEEVAYTWFNRLIAIRFMEVNGYLPSAIRILSSVDSGRVEPDCVREYARLDFLSQETAAELAAESDDRLYRYILVEQCRALGNIMPGMFTHIADYAALLLPDRLYIKDGLVHDLIHAISEEDFGEQVEIIGWLYQYYISEKKDEVFAALKKNVKITRENIPAATQLFTPDWIVKYMVENSLGRLWLERHPDSPLREGWKYYLDEAVQTPDVRAQLDKLVAQNPISKPEEIRLIDPCMGSGHILVYAFDVLFQIYQSIGYADRDIPDLILEHNLYGLDIDERACQLAYFALMMKARSYNRRFFRREAVPQPQVYAPQGYDEGMEYGSLVKVEELEEKPAPRDADSLFNTPYEAELNTWNFRRLLHQKYDVVVTNPPYMGSNGMGTKLSEYVKKSYPGNKSDLFAVFMEKCGEMLNTNGYQAMITMESWMFLSSFEKMRKKAFDERMIVNLIHMPYLGKGGTSLGINFGTSAFVMQKCQMKAYYAQYMCICYYETDENGVPLTFPVKNERYRTMSAASFKKIPGEPVAYWVSNNLIEAFDNGEKIADNVECYVGMRTGDNERFLRYWYEVSIKICKLHDCSREDTISGNVKWVPYLKGGDFRRWYYNYDYVVNWYNDGKDIKDNTRRVYPQLGDNLSWKITNEAQYFKEGITFNAISSSIIGFKRFKKGAIFSNASHAVMSKDSVSLDRMLAFLNTTVVKDVLALLSPTINYTPNDIGKIPYIGTPNTEMIDRISAENIYLSKTDWDSFETSWDFQTHPLINGEPSTQSAFTKWQQECEDRFQTLKSNEEELNRIFIGIYGLQDELTPEVEDKDVTVRRADLGRDIRSFVSYAVGCMFGRYSLDAPGLAYAGGGWDDSKYGSFLPEDDNILPITDADYFEDDIVMRFVDFVRVVYGEDTLTENLEFIAKALYPTGNGTAREMIRRYFQTDFFKDHCKIYQKRPIYWLFDSAGSSRGSKQNGFKALIYLHRYDKYTVARVRTEYLHPLQRKYEAEIVRMEGLSELPETSARDKAEYKKQTEKISKQIAECRAYDQIISHMANQQIELDLDNGVKVNYAKFQGVEVPLSDSNGTVKMDLLGRI